MADLGLPHGPVVEMNDGRASMDIDVWQDYARRANRFYACLVAMTYVHPCNCGDEIPQGQCARCRAVKALGFDPAEIDTVIAHG